MRKKLEAPVFAIYNTANTITMFDNDDEFFAYVQAQFESGATEVPFLKVRIVKRGTAVKPTVKLKMEK